MHEAVQLFAVCRHRHSEPLLEIMNLNLPRMLCEGDAGVCVLLGRVSKHGNGGHPESREGDQSKAGQDLDIALHIFFL